MRQRASQTPYRTPDADNPLSDADDDSGDTAAQLRITSATATRRQDWLVAREVSQRFEFKGLKFFRFSSHPLWLSVDVV